MVNKVILVGNVGRDPEIRRTQAGDPVATFSIATSERWRDKATGDQKERTEWHNIVVFNENIAKVCEQYVKKGSKIYVEGQLQTREYVDRDGVTRRTTEIVLTKFRGELQLLSTLARTAPDQSSYGTTRTRDAASTNSAPAASSYAGPHDDIPF